MSVVEDGSRTSFVTLGTADGTPQADRGPSSTYVTHHDFRFLVDIGSGALQKLMRVGGDPSSLDAVFLTHAHVDHIGDLLPLLFGIAVGTIRRKSPLVIYGSEETLRYAHALGDAFAYWLDRLGNRVDYRIVEPTDRFCLHNTTVTIGTVEHTSSSVAYRWQFPNKKCLVICGDTGVHPPLVSFAQDADALLIECGSDPASPLPHHLTPTQLVALLRATRPATAYVVHRPPTLLSDDIETTIEETYGGTIVFPRDLDGFMI